MTELALVLIGGLKFGAIYALAAIGLVAVHKATRTVNFAHGGLVLLGAFFSFLIVVHWGLSAWWAFLVVPIAVGLIAGSIELVVLRPLRNADAFLVVIATVFLGIAISEVFRLTYNTEILAVPPLWNAAPIIVGGIILTPEALWTIGGAVLIGLVTIILFEKAEFCRGMRAMASNPRGAQLCGYSVNLVYAAAWFLGGALAGLAGIFAAPANGISPDLAIAVIASAFVAAVLGGFDSLRGAVLGGLILGVSETLAAAYVSSAFKSAVSFLILFLVLLWRPQGLFPEARARDV